MNRNNADEVAVDRRTKRTMELAAMLKEKFSGNNETMKRLIAKFALQEGVTERKARSYLKLLRDSGIIVQKLGHKLWKYDSRAEWDLFKIEI